MIKVQTVKKPTLQIQEQQPRNIQRADIAPANGFALVVDGHFKTEFDDEAASQKAAKELLEKYPMLQVEALRIDLALIFLPLRAPAGDVRTVAFAGDDAFF